MKKENPDQLVHCFINNNFNNKLFFNQRKSESYENSSAAKRARKWFPKENSTKEKNSNDKVCKKLYSHFAMGRTYHCFTRARNLWFLFIHEYVLECDKSVSSLFISMPFISCPEVFWMKLVKMFAWKTPPCTNKLRNTRHIVLRCIYIHSYTQEFHCKIWFCWSYLESFKESIRPFWYPHTLIKCCKMCACHHFASRNESRHKNMSTVTLMCVSINILYS